MNKEFIRRMMWTAHYSLKPGTSATYLFSEYAGIDAITDGKEKAAATIELLARNRSEGREMLLPFRIYFIQDDAAPVCHSGRGAREKFAQMKGAFTKREESPYKIAAPFKVCTSVWQIKGSRCLFYGTLGVTPGEGKKPIDNGDLIVFFTPDWREVDIYIFKGLGKPNEVANLQEAVDFVEGIVIRG